MKIFYRIIPFLLVLILFSCQPKKIMNIEEILLPPGAETRAIDGRYEVELDGATNSILSDLKKSYSKTQEKILFLPPSTEAAKIFEFYTLKMTEKGLKKDEGVPLQGRNYQLNVWKNDGQAVAVAVIDAGKDAEGKAIKFLAIYTGEK